MLVGGDYISPSEFWQLDPAEIWWIYESKLEQQRAAQAGAAGATLSEDDNEELYQMLVREGAVGG